MIAVILTTHVLIVLALIGIVLLQRSEGGALGMGGGGGGGFMTGRGAANALTRTTSILAALFFATSLGLAIIADRGESDQSVLQELTTGGQEQPAAPTGVGEASTDDLLRSLGAEEETTAPAAAPTDEPAETPAAEPEAAPAPEAIEETPPADEPNQ